MIICSSIIERFLQSVWSPWRPQSLRRSSYRLLQQNDATELFLSNYVHTGIMKNGLFPFDVIIIKETQRYFS